jgi:hypothetical protein
LSLAVVPPDVTVDPDHAEKVWKVTTVADLAKHLEDAGLLAPLFVARGPLDRSGAAQVLDRLRRLVIQEHRYSEAADLGDRVRRCGLASSIDPGVRVELARFHAEACRYHGHFAEATTVSQEAYESIASLRELGCDDEEADAAATYAASLFSGHRFADIPPLLQAWAATAIREPRRFRPLTRVKVWNTLGRAKSILEQSGWDELFNTSLALHRNFSDSENVNRTAHYRVHAYLRSGDTEGAKRAMSEMVGCSESSLGDPWMAFLRANLARLENRRWVDPILEERIEKGDRPYSAWLYVQATARQASQSQEEMTRRFGLAIQLLREQAGGVAKNICTFFAELLTLSAAARELNHLSWQTARASAENYLNNADSYLRAYYSPVIASLPVVPDLTTAETVLNRVPYF